MVALSTSLETVIYNVAVANTTLWNSVSGKMKHGRPIAGWKTPYVTYSYPNLPGSNVYGANAPRVFSLTIYFDIFSSEVLFSAEAGPIAGYIRTVFDGASLPLAGFNDTVIKLGNERTIETEDTGLWHIQISYNGMVCAT